MICFDMDGTIADLYGVPNWLKRLRAEDETPYIEAKPMWDMLKLRAVLLKLIKQGWEVRIITWLSKDSTPEYKQKVRQAKAEWLTRFDFPTSKCHMVAYGTTKADCVRRIAEPAILIDDNAKIRNGWTLGDTIDPVNCDLIAELEKLVVA